MASRMAGRHAGDKRSILRLSARKTPIISSAQSLPPLNAVRAFVAAARHGSFKLAADQLGVTYGAVGRQVALLEQWLGRPPLFRRLSRGVALTLEGEALLAEFGPALDRIGAAARIHRARKGTAAATILRVNALATFSLRWLLPRLALFRTVHPEIEVRLTTSNEPIDALSSEFDVVIRGGPDTFHGYTCRMIVGERRVAVCSPTLLLRTPLEQPSDLERHTLLHVATMPRLWDAWLATAGCPDLQPASGLTLDHFYLAIQAAIDGLGVAIGPTALIEDDLATGRLTVLCPGISLPARSYFANVPQNGPSNPAGRTFCDWLESLAVNATHS